MTEPDKPVVLAELWPGPVRLTVEELWKLNPGIDETRAEAMIADAIALAAVDAPCILRNDFEYADAAKVIIKGAILRWYDQGSGAMSSMSADVFSASYDTRNPRSATGFWKSEKKALARLCGHGAGAYTIDITNHGEYYDEPPWMEFVDP